MSDLARLIWAIVSHFPDGVSAKKLVKLLYFVDLRAAETLGHTLTGTSYTYHLFGPFPHGFFPCRDELLRSGDCITVSVLPDWDLDWHLHRPRTVCGLDENFGQQEREVIREVLQSLGKHSGRALERMSKATEPMKRACRGDILGLTAADRQRIAWERAGIPVAEMEKHVRPLAFTKEQERRWGKEEAAMLRDLEPLRKRANAAYMGEELAKE